MSVNTPPTLHSIAVYDLVRDHAHSTAGIHGMCRVVRSSVDYQEPCPCDVRSDADEPDA